MRYSWTRAGQYSQYTSRSHPDTDYVLFTEIWVSGGKVAAMEIFLVNAAGQVAYLRLFNSHHFGNELSAEGDGATEFLVRQLLQDLERDPKQLFPKYGVG